MTGFQRKISANQEKTSTFSLFIELITIKTYFFPQEITLAPQKPLFALQSPESAACFIFFPPFTLHLSPCPFMIRP